jgi:hypothetical protein
MFKKMIREISNFFNLFKKILIFLPKSVNLSWISGKFLSIDDIFPFLSIFFCSIKEFEIIVAINVFNFLSFKKMLTSMRMLINFKEKSLKDMLGIFFENIK